MRRAAPSRLSPRVPTPECRTMSSESCCSADSAYLSRSPRNAALAGDSWTCTATTGRPAHSGSAGAESWPLGAGSGSHLQGGRCPRRIACRPPRPQPRCARERRTPYRGGRQRPPPMAGRQVAVDATVVSPARRNGQPRPRADQQPRLALAQAVDRKGRTYPELKQARRCRLVVFGVGTLAKPRPC